MTVFAPIATDSYKVSHAGFVDESTSMIYSNWTGRSDAWFTAKSDFWDSRYVVTGIQEFCVDWMMGFWHTTFFDLPKYEACAAVKSFISEFQGLDFDATRFEKLHDLGYLPICIRSLKDGTLCPIGVPSTVIYNTHKDFDWLTNYLETLFSSEVWKQMTVATIARQFRKLFEKWADKTCENNFHVDFQGHDFSLRGASNMLDGSKYGVGHLLYFKGTDTLPAVWRVKKYYDVDGMVGTSIPASEHSVASLGYATSGELESFRKWITKDYPNGFVSLVSDTTDYWKVLSDYLPALKNEIMARDGRVVVRPDSGDPVEIICGFPYITVDVMDDAAVANAHHEGYGYVIESSTGKAYHIDCQKVWDDWKLVSTEVDPRVVKGSIELLWETFGGVVNSKGYRELDSHIGLIYGDSITFERAGRIFEQLAAKGFASNCVVYGIGSFTYNYITRDTLGFAVKATAAVVDGETFALSKAPVTDRGLKKSARGFLGVYKDEAGKLYLKQDLNAIPDDDEMVVYFKDGALFQNANFSEIRARANA